MPAPEGFEFRTDNAGVVTVLHHGTVAARLRGATATRFLSDVERGDPQLLMARVTGNYRRGNERTAARHPRNSGR